MKLWDAAAMESIEYTYVSFQQRYKIKSPPWTILWFKILGIFSVENTDRLGVFMFQT